MNPTPHASRSEASSYSGYVVEGIVTSPSGNVSVGEGSGRPTGEAANPGILTGMPVIIVGADTEYGAAIARRLTSRDGEVRAFVTDTQSAQPLRDLGIKVAVGDVSDNTHIEGAALNAFSAVLVAEAGLDDRERSFAATFDRLVGAWLEGISAAGVRRVIWVGDGPTPAAIADSDLEVAAIDTTSETPDRAADEVLRLDDLAEL